MTEQDAATSFDVVVVGSGAAGMSAAIAAAHAGLSVLVLESTARFGGTTALSGGGAWIPNNSLMADQDQADSPEAALLYLRGLVSSPKTDAKLVAYVDQAPKMMAFMTSSTSVKFSYAPVPDYEPALPGFRVGRTVLPVSFEGRALGADLRFVREPLPQMGLFGMQLDFEDIPRFRNATGSIKDFMYVAGVFGQHLWDMLWLRRSARLAGGNALVARLLASARALGVVFWRNASAEELITSSGGGVAGVRVLRGGSLSPVKANAGVVLATGGFGANAQMREQYIPLAEEGWSLQPDGARGAGIRLGVSAGGRVASGNDANGIWVPVSAQRKAHELTVFPHAFLDRHCPGFIVVDESGSRFVNEAFHYQHFGSEIRKRDIRRCFLIADHTAVRQYGIGLAKPKPFSIAAFLKSGYLVSAKSVGGLAQKLGLDEERLEATVARYNSEAINGRDPDFHRGEDAYSAFMGDPTHTPNPNVAPLLDPPFYALELRPGEFCTVVGLETDDKAQVLDAADRPIDGLYAAGNDMNSVWLGAYPGGGAGIGPAMTFGYIAGQALANRSHRDLAGLKINTTHGR